MIFCLLKTKSTISRDGDLLAVITDKSPNLLIWDANSNRSQWLDTGNVYFRVHNNKYKYSEELWNAL